MEDAEAGRLSWRAVSIVCRFPDDGSPLFRALVKDAPEPTKESPPWEPRTQDQLLMVLLINSVSHLSWMIANYGRKSPTPAKPPRIELPGDVDHNKETITGRAVSVEHAETWVARYEKRRAELIRKREGS